MAPSSTGDVLCDPLRQKFVEILNSNGIWDDVDKVVMTEPPELVGEHMATATVYLRYEFKDKDVKDKNLFVKKFTNNAGHTAFIKKGRLMEKEMSFFTEFLPKAKAFCAKYKGCEKLLDLFPKCWYADEEMIVLENLVLDDTFIMLDKEEKQDLFTAKLVLGNLAKFHAVTYAFIEEEIGGSEKFAELYERQCFEAFLQEGDPMMEGMFDNGAATCINLLKGHPVDGDSEACTTLTSYMGKSFPLVISIMKPKHETEKLLVLNHGDFHNNNMLFKKDAASGRVKDHVFVDLQITRLGSPSLDIGYYMYTSVQPKIRRAHLMELLRHYYDNFVTAVGMFDKKCPISYEDFVSDYRVKSQLGFFTNLSFIAAIGALKDINMEAMTEDPVQMMELFNTAIRNWIAKNPEKAAAIAEEVVAMVKEHAEVSGAL